MTAAGIAISEEARSRFAEDGYWLGPQLFDAGQREALAYAVDEVNAGRYETGREPMARFWSPGDDPYALRKVDNWRRCNPVLAEAVRNRQIGRLAARLLGTAAVRLWREQILMKPAGGRVSANVAWRQDDNDWVRHDRPRMLTAWIPLQEVNPELGTKHFVKGSHRWGWHAAYSHFGRYDMEARERVIRQLHAGGGGVRDRAGLFGGGAGQFPPLPDAARLGAQPGAAPAPPRDRDPHPGRRVPLVQDGRQGGRP